MPVTAGAGPASKLSCNKKIVLAASGVTYAKTTDVPRIPKNIPAAAAHSGRPCWRRGCELSGVDATPGNVTRRHCCRRAKAHFDIHITDVLSAKLFISTEQLFELRKLSVCGQTSLTALD